MENSFERIKVVMRCRPLGKREIAKKREEIIHINKQRKELIIKNSKIQKKPIMFTYDFVYGQDSKQENIYKECSKPIIDFYLKVLIVPFSLMDKPELEKLIPWKVLVKKKKKE